MTPVQRAREWLDHEKPARDEIQQSVDNLCHQLPHPPTGSSREELMLAISLLMSVLGGAVEDLVLPETAPSPAPAAGFDLGPLGSKVDTPSEVSIDQSPEAKAERFRQLKESFRSWPF